MYIVKNWCESSDSIAGCFGKVFKEYGNAKKIMDENVTNFVKENEINDEDILDEGNLVSVDFYGVRHFWEIEYLTIAD